MTGASVRLQPVSIPRRSTEGREAADPQGARNEQTGRL